MPLLLQEPAVGLQRQPWASSAMLPACLKLDLRASEQARTSLSKPSSRCRPAWSNAKQVDLDMYAGPCILSLLQQCSWLDNQSPRYR